MAMIEADTEHSNPVKHIRRQQGTVILDLAGEIDLHSSVQLRGVLLEELRAGAPVLMINLTGVSFMDSSGLATLIEALQLARRQGGQLKLFGLQGRVRSLFEIARLDGVFGIYDSEAEALA